MGLFSRRRAPKATRAIEPFTGMDQLTDLQAPPFGLGFRREATNLMTGITPAGRHYRKFMYSYSGGLSRFNGSVVVVDLPFSLPDVFWTNASKNRAGIELGGRIGCLQHQSLRVCSTDQKVAKQVFDAVADPTVALAMETNGPVDLSVDRNHLVAVDVPPTEQLPEFLAGLDRIIDALRSAVPRRLELPPRVERHGFYGHEDWDYQLQGDKALIREFGLPARNQGRIEDQLTCACAGVRMVSFNYTWLSDTAARTQLTRGMVMDSDREREPVCAFVLDSQLPDLSLNGEELGAPVQLGNFRFADNFALRSTDPQKAYQLFNERVQEWLLETHPYGWTARGHVIRFHVPTHDASVVAECEAILHGWLDRVPPSIREELGLPEMPALMR